MLYQIHHLNHYHYQSHVEYSFQQLHLYPKNSPFQKVWNWAIDAPYHLNQSLDTYGNYLHTFNIERWQTITELQIYAKGSVEAFGLHEVDIKQLELNDKVHSPNWLYLRQTDLTKPTPVLKAFAEQYRSKNTENQMLDLMQGIKKFMQYQPKITHVDTSAHEAFLLKQGVCQDFTHIYLTCARYLGLPCRYVSGYFFDINTTDQAMASHAWVDVFLENRLISLDVTNGIYTNKQHIRLAHGLDYQDVAPIRGVRIGGGKEEMQVKLTIEPKNQPLQINVPYIEKLSEYCIV